MALTLVHQPPTQPLSSTTVSDSRDYQSSAQVLTQILTNQANAVHTLINATTGDLLVATSPTILGSLPAPATGLVLTSQGVGALPIWSAPALVAASFPLLATDGT